VRILVGCLLVVAATVAVAQTSQELRNHYGDPEVERFNARPGVGLTVEYGSDRLACQILIQPPEHILSSQEQKARFMASETVTDILDEVVPLTTRGKKTGDFHMVSGCNAVDSTEYENVWITRSTHNCLPLKPEREVRATVIFKRATCPSQTK
jgi:hypothetical protein